jgi:hypothetical protein
MICPVEEPSTDNSGMFCQEYTRVRRWIYAVPITHHFLGAWIPPSGACPAHSSGRTAAWSPLTVAWFVRAGQRIPSARFFSQILFRLISRQLSSAARLSSRSAFLDFARFAFLRTSRQLIS